MSLPEQERHLDPGHGLTNEVEYQMSSFLNTHQISEMVSKQLMLAENKARNDQRELMSVRKNTISEPCVPGFLR